MRDTLERSQKSDANRSVEDTKGEMVLDVSVLQWGGDFRQCRTLLNPTESNSRRGSDSEGVQGVAGRKKPEEHEVETQESDFGTPEARRQAFHVIEQTDPNNRASKRVRIEDNLEWYVRRHYLSRIQADALRKWQADAYLSGIMPACIGSYAQQVTGGQSEISDLRLAAQARRTHAIEFLSKTGRYSVKLVDAVAVDGRPAGRYFMHEGYGSPNDALVLLSKCTEALAKHYGLMR